MIIYNPTNCHFHEAKNVYYGCTGIVSSVCDEEEIVDVTPVATSQSQVQQPTNETDATRLAVKNAIIKVMNKVDEQGKFILTQQRQWFGIYRIMADKKFVPEEKWCIFDSYIDTLFSNSKEPLRVKLNAEDLSRVAVTPFNRPFHKWRIEDYDGKRSVFEAHYTIAESFLKELECY